MFLVERKSSSAAALPYELVERKGVGHPDTMCDAMAERMSQYYSQYCLKHFGGVAHHWFDKVMLCGGGANVDFGAGEMVRPYRVIVAGKAAFAVGSEEIPVLEILRTAAVDVLSSVTTGFDPERHLVVESVLVDHQGAGRGVSRYQPTSRNDLVSVFADGLKSNDTNLLHGYAPLSALENAVLGLERLINGDTFKAANPDTGWDVKVFGSRRGEEYRLVANMPFLAASIHSMDDYLQRKEQVYAHLRQYLSEMGLEQAHLLMNATDRNGRPYLTAIGSVADTGDVGVVGRGNRTNGLITPMRPMSIEAPAGKNPLDHTGKIYGVVTHRLAQQAYEITGQETEAHIFTTKEAPLTDPDEVVLRLADGSAYEVALQQLMRDSIAGVGDITREFIETGVTLW